jgi:hypothetical protein
MFAHETLRETTTTSQSLRRAIGAGDTAMLFLFRELRGGGRSFVEPVCEVNSLLTGNLTGFCGIMAQTP